MVIIFTLFTTDCVFQHLLIQYLVIQRSSFYNEEKVDPTSSYFVVDSVPCYSTVSFFTTKKVDPTPVCFVEQHSMMTRTILVRYLRWYL